MNRLNQTKAIRRRFYRGLVSSLHVVWPILSVLLAGIVVLGLLVASLEGWHLGEGIYFAFVTGLTVGYGDLVPKHHLSRIAAVAIGGIGILLTATLAAVSVRALEQAIGRQDAGER